MTSEEVLLETFKILPKNRKQELLDYAKTLEQKEAVKKSRVSLLHLNLPLVTKNRKIQALQSTQIVW
ncbi:MAG: DUF2281 domain-containing protein [Acidobacteriota bacterium]|nr:DUF2281 domain-containing protein [Acidobacteriota bacterium]